MSDPSLDALIASPRVAFQTGDEVAIDDSSPLQRAALARVLAELGRDGSQLLSPAGRLLRCATRNDCAC